MDKITTRLSTNERQEQILDEAIRIIHEQGYSALVIRELANHVGISEPAIYRHFKNKNDIISRILDRVLGMTGTIEANLVGVVSAKEKIRQFVRFHFDFLNKNPEITSVVFSENLFQSNSILKEKLRTILNSRHGLLSSFLDEAKLEGSVVDVDSGDLAVLIVGNIRLIVLEWRLADFNFDLRRRGNRALKMLERLIFA
jgi:AcrR family transcriptional regulator